MPTIELGNISVISVITDPETGVQTKYRANHIDQSVTTMAIPSDRDLMSILRDATNLWSHQSDAPPAWLRCDDPELESILRRHFNCGAPPEEFPILISGPPLLVPMGDVPTNTTDGEDD